MEKQKTAQKSTEPKNIRTLSLEELKAVSGGKGSSVKQPVWPPKHRSI